MADADDIRELETLLASATRARVKTALESVLAGWKNRAHSSHVPERVEAPKEDAPAAAEAGGAAAGDEEDASLAFVAIPSFAWEQSEEKVKLYVTDALIAGVGTLPRSQVTVDVTPRAIDIRIVGLRGHNYRLGIAPLFEAVDASAPKIVVKENRISLFVRKAAPSHWKSLTKKENPLSNVGSSAKLGGDPSDSIMGLMQDLYRKGDDSMRKTIAEAWQKGMDHKAAGGSLLDDEALP